MKQPGNTPAVAFFDFDGTISERDSLPLFLRFACGNVRYYTALLRFSPIILGYFAGLVHNGKAKEKLIGSLMAGRNRQDILKVGESFCESVIPRILRPQALECIAEHKNNGHRVVVVTASLEEWLAPWCRSLDIEIQGTRLEYAPDNRATGRFGTPNCQGAEKVRRVKELLDAGSRPATYAYGDSQGDKELLAWADQSWYRPFR